MSQITSNPALDEANIRLDSSGRAATICFALGAVGLLVAFISLFASAKDAVAGLHMGACMAIGLSLGGLFFTMVFSLTNAGWSATIRRQFENLMWCLPVGFVFLVISVALQIGGIELASWKNHEIIAEGYFIEHKALWYSDVAVVLRLVIYAAVWFGLSRAFWVWSRRQDETGDPMLSRKIRFNSAYGLLLFALATSFFAFDWLMGLADYRFFSTMWGVYYFAAVVFSTVPAAILILFFLNRAGKLQGIVTEEHLHDLSKFAFGFTVFWAYIAYSQYFLIWYSNIPEETTFFIYRKEHWAALTATLAVGHFIVPWYFLLWRPLRRSWTGMAVVCVYMLVMNVLDFYWIVRPVVDLGAENPGSSLTIQSLLVNTAGIVGVLGVFAGVLIRQIAANPLIAVNDPRLQEGLHHKNYV
jgi:hypothetical protein